MLCLLKSVSVILLFINDTSIIFNKMLLLHQNLTFHSDLSKRRMLGKTLISRCKKFKSLFHKFFQWLVFIFKKVLIILTENKQLKMFRFWCNDSNSYFTILVEVFSNQIFAENMYFTNHMEWTDIIMSLFSNVIIVITFLLMIFTIVHFFIKLKFCKHHFYRPKITKCKDKTITQTFIY